jgi:multiple sugar transport system ATP-binding protein
MASVRLERITRKFSNTTAIDNITFTVPDGEFWVLVGPSGCGKSTILRTIAGLETATSGNLFVGDVLMNKVPARQRDVAMVFQNYALYPHMTVAQNLAFGLQMRQTDRAQIAERVEKVARSLDIAHLLERKPKQLSGGQQQRVALGRAIVRQPQVFLLDEPLSNLDTQLRDDTRAELKQLQSAVGITTIYVTHDRVEAMTLADRIVVLERGRIQQIDTPQRIYARPANRMVATFLGSPPMNILPAIYTGEFQVGSQSLPCLPKLRQQLSAIAGQSFDLGIRPEHISLLDTGSFPELPEDLAAKLTVEVKVIEPLGEKTLIRSILPDANVQLQVQTAGYWPGHIGDRLQVQFDLSHLFVFDPATGETLYPQN